MFTTDGEYFRTARTHEGKHQSRVPSGGAWTPRMTATWDPVKI